jgi:hypothetical protein
MGVKVGFFAVRRSLLARAARSEGEDMRDVGVGASAA